MTAGFVLQPGSTLLVAGEGTPKTIAMQRSAAFLMSILAKVIVFEIAFWGGLAVFLFSDISFVVATIFFLGLGSISFLIRCPNCGKGVFVRGQFVVPWPNSVCTRCGSVLIGKARSRLSTDEG